MNPTLLSTIAETRARRIAYMLTVLAAIAQTGAKI